MRKTASLVLLAIGMFSTSAGAQPSNVALDALVTLQGGSFFTDGWGGGMVVDPSTIVDGEFLAKETQWDQGPVWWDANDDEEVRSIEIDLGGDYLIESYVVQADDNEAYRLYYWDSGMGDWEPLQTIDNYDAFGNGMLTRPNPDDNSETAYFASPVVTSALLLEGDYDSLDKLYAVSELQVYGYLPVSVDLKPGSDPNSVNLCSKGKIPVALFGAEDFDIMDVDLSTVSLSGAHVALKKRGRYMASRSDVNGDGFRDLMLHFETRMLNLDSSEDEVVLTGHLADGTAFRGTDSVRVVKRVCRK